MSKLKTLTKKADAKPANNYPYICSTLEKDPLLSPTIVAEICDGRACYECGLSMFQFGKLEHIKVKHE